MGEFALPVQLLLNMLQLDPGLQELPDLQELFVVLRRLKIFFLVLWELKSGEI